MMRVVLLYGEQHFVRRDNGMRSVYMSCAQTKTASGYAEAVFVCAIK